LNLDVEKLNAGVIGTAQSLMLMHIVMRWMYVLKRKRLVPFAEIQWNVVLAFAIEMSADFFQMLQV